MEAFKDKHIDSVSLEHRYLSGFETHQGLDPQKREEKKINTSTKINIKKKNL